MVPVVFEVFTLAPCSSMQFKPYFKGLDMAPVVFLVYLWLHVVACIYK